MPTWPTSAGFTLLEALVVLAVAAVLLGIGAPAFTDHVLDARRTGAINDLVTAIQLARSEAVKRGREVVLCKAPTADECVPTAQWDAGWVVFLNLDRDRPARIDADEPILHIRRPLEQAVMTGNRDAFAFHAFHRRSTNGTIVYCDRRGAERARAVILSVTGRPRVARTYADGSELACP